MKILEFLFGKGPQKGSPTERYQTRLNGMVNSGSLLVTGIWTFLIYITLEKNLILGITLGFFVIYNKIHEIVGRCSDALFDSLWERINLQSNWIDKRLYTIERNISCLIRFQKELPSETRENMMEHNNIDESYFDYPEKSKDE